MKKSQATNIQSLHITNNALKAWARYTKLETGGQLQCNSPTHLTHYRCKDSKRYHNPNWVCWTRQAQTLDTLLNELGQHKPNWAHALVDYYLNDRNIRQLAKKHGISKSTFHERLQRGRHWIDTKLQKQH